MKKKGLLHLDAESDFFATKLYLCTARELKAFKRAKLD